MTDVAEFFAGSGPVFRFAITRNGSKFSPNARERRATWGRFNNPNSKLDTGTFPGGRPSARKNYAVFIDVYNQWATLDSNQ